MCSKWIFQATFSWLDGHMQKVTTTNTVSENSYKTLQSILGTYSQATQSTCNQEAKSSAS